MCARRLCLTLNFVPGPRSRKCIDVLGLLMDMNFNKAINIDVVTFVSFVSHEDPFLLIQFICICPIFSNSKDNYEKCTYEY